MHTNQSLLEKRLANVPSGIVTGAPIFIERAENAYVWDVEGNRYVDFAGGIGVLNTGHCHPQVIAAAKQQTERMTHTCFQVCGYESYVLLAERLNQLAPGASAKKTIFFNSGAEAVENAIKIARAATKRSVCLAFHGGFHGRTLMATKLAGKVDPYKKQLGDLPGSVYHIPFPDQLHGVDEHSVLEALEHLLKFDVDVQDIAAMIVEPVQGEGGFRVASVSLLQQLRAFCDQHGIVLIADEVQCGFGRTGRFFAIEHSGVEPDLITTAKSLAGGFPLSGVIGQSAIMEAALPGSLGGTYAGNPIACAAALAVLDVFEQESLLERSSLIGARITEFLTACAQQSYGSCITEVRGLGGMVGFEMQRAEQATLLRKIALELGLLLISAGVYNNTIRILVPLTVSDEVLEEGLSKLQEAFIKLTEQDASC